MSRTNKSNNNDITVLKATGNNIAKIRCPNCKQQAHPTPDGLGGTLLYCPGCGGKFKTHSL